MLILNAGSGGLTSNFRPILAGLKDRFNYETYGSAPILGVGGLVFKMHGSSNANAVYHAALNAARVASGNVVEEIRSAIKDYQKA